MECQTNINLDKLSRDFDNMRRDILWASCPFCGSFLLPKIGVRLGREINHFNKLKFNTSSYEAVVLYSPFFLKYNYNNGLLKEFKFKLDVNNFKMRFNAIFWDSIWYFKIKELDYEFMLPYEFNLKLDLFKQVNKHLAVNFQTKNNNSIPNPQKSNELLKRYESCKLWHNFSKLKIFPRL